MNEWKKTATRVLSGFLLLICAPSLALADFHTGAQVRQGVPPELRPNAIKGVGVDQKVGSRVSPDLKFVDELGHTVTLKDYMDGKPIILVPVYYHCPRLCTSTLNNLTGLLRTIPFQMGKDYRVLTFSFDPKDGPKTALAKKRTYLARYGKGPQTDDNPGWHFLTGKEPAIRKLTSEIGFRYKRDPASGTYAHGAVFMMLTPDGTLSRYFSGFKVSPLDLRLSLVQASKGKIGSVTDFALLYCFHYDPNTGRYAPTIFALLKLMGIFTLITLGVLVYALSRKGRAA